MILARMRNANPKAQVAAKTIINLDIRSLNLMSDKITLLQFS
jgi:hypothetical protein